MGATGIVHGVNMQASNGDLGFTLIDATGGISLFSTDAFGYTVNEGDEVRVTGTISVFNCLAQISPTNIELDFAVYSCFSSLALIFGKILFFNLRKSFSQ